jgi:hypothetical protein
MRKSSPAAAAAVALIVGLTSGCGSSGPAQPETVPVTGKITFKGKPVTKGQVNFQPADGPPAVGDIQADGTFALSTFTQGDGAVLGRHRVIVNANDGNPALMPGSPGYKKPKALVPKRYLSARTSGLDADVSKEKREFAFELK